MVEHVKAMHTRERPFRCMICARGFLRLSHLNEHTKFARCRGKDSAKEQPTEVVGDDGTVAGQSECATLK